MRRIPLAVAMLIFVGACEARSQAPKTDDEKTLYALGLSIGRNLATFNLSKSELQFVIDGLTDQVTGNKPAVEINEFGPKIQEMARKRNSARSDAEKAKGDAFLAKVAGEKGAVTN